MTEGDRASYRQLVEKYAAVLNAWLAAPDIAAESPVPPFPGPPWLLAACPLIADQDGVAQLLVASGERAIGLRELRDFTNGAQRLIIIDPYFLVVEATMAESYVSEVAKTARFDEIREIHIVYNDRCVTKKVLSKFKAAARAAGVRVSLRGTQSFHDRIWIADGNRAVAVGTSLNGLGTRAAFILRLPAEDLAYIQEFLRKHRLGP